MSRRDPRKRSPALNPVRSSSVEDGADGLVLGIGLHALVDIATGQVHRVIFERVDCRRQLAQDHCAPGASRGAAWKLPVVTVS